jgi:hypothetical protein
MTRTSHLKGSRKLQTFTGGIISGISGGGGSGTGSGLAYGDMYRQMSRRCDRKWQFTLPVVVPASSTPGGTADGSSAAGATGSNGNVSRTEDMEFLHLEALLPLLVGGLKAASVPRSSTLLLLQKSLAPHSSNIFYKSNPRAEALLCHPNLPTPAHGSRRTVTAAPIYADFREACMGTKVFAPLGT